MFQKFTQEEEIARTRIPKEGEMLAVVINILGNGRMTVECNDGKTRMGRIPGKLRKRVWIRMNDLVIVEPWSVESEKKCDIVWKYTKTQAQWLKKKGYTKSLPLD